MKDTKKIVNNSVSFIFVVLIILGFYSVINNMSNQFEDLPDKVTRKAIDSNVKSDKKIESHQKAINTQLPIFGSLQEISKYYTKEEISLLAEGSKLKLDINELKIFIEGSRELKTKSEMQKLVKEIGKNNLLLKLMLVKYVNKKFPNKTSDKFKGIERNKKNNLDKIFKKIKKV